jgi:hypothetical protein
VLQALSAERPRSAGLPSSCAACRSGRAGRSLDTIGGDNMIPVITIPHLCGPNFTGLIMVAFPVQILKTASSNIAPIRSEVG